MTAVHATKPIQESNESAAQSGASVLLSLATLLQETVIRFETTVGLVTDLAINGPARNDHGLVVAMQDFDRLQQEFTAVAELLTKIGSHCSTETLASDVALRAIEEISMSHLKSRLISDVAAIATARDEPAEISSEVEDEMVF
jgi:hypothetical protein